MSAFSFSFLISSFCNFVLNRFYTRERCIMACGTMVRIEQKWKTISIKFILDGEYYTIKESTNTLRRANYIFENLNESWRIQNTFAICSKKHKQYCELKLSKYNVECQKCSRSWSREDGHDLELQKSLKEIEDETVE